MNLFLKSQIDNMIQTLQAFETGCEMAARQDDGKIDKKEEAALKKLKKGVKDFTAVLKDIQG